MQGFNPFLGVAMIVVILNLGAPLDYHLILGAGLFTAIYILARAFGKYFGAYFGASITKSPKTVKKFLGLTLLPHSGVSLVFTGIAVSVLTGPAPECAKIIQGTIAAAAVINEVLAVIIAKKGFEWAGEFNRETGAPAAAAAPTIITISRQHGSGGREVGRQLSEKLGIPFYDQEIIELAAQSSSVDKSFYEDAASQGAEGFLQELAAGFRHDLTPRDKAFLHQASVIRDIANRGGCVIVGRCADYVLRDRPNVLKVYVYADLQSRKERLEHIYHEADDIALGYIEKIDKNRVSYYNFYTGRQFGDAQNYDICLNSSLLGIERCAELIGKAYETQKVTP